MRWTRVAGKLYTVTIYGLFLSLCVSFVLLGYSSGPRHRHTSTTNTSLTALKITGPRQYFEKDEDQESFHVISLRPLSDPVVFRQPSDVVSLTKSPKGVVKRRPKMGLHILKRVRGEGMSIFMFSAVIGNSSRNAPWDRLYIQGWEVKNYTKTLACCVQYRSGYSAVYPVTTTRWLNISKTFAVQYSCPLKIAENDIPIYVRVTAAPTCHRLFNWYLVPNFSYRHNNQIAVCTKLAYGELAADDILSWFEVHRRLGINKVMTFTYKLNAEATRVLEYYQSIGLAEVVPFELPVTGEKRPDVGAKRAQAWTDEQVCVFDCLARLSGYKYLLTIDFDEYLIPKREKSLFTMFENMFRRKPKAAGFHFLVQLHITSWDKTGHVSQFKAGQYLNRTKTMKDRMKHVVRPERLQNGRLTTHSYTPNYTMGYKKFRTSESQAVIHHFRSCRSDWAKNNHTSCYDLKRYTDTTVANIVLGIEDRLLSLKKVIFSGS